MKKLQLASIAAVVSCFGFLIVKVLLFDTEGATSLCGNSFLAPQIERDFSPTPICCGRDMKKVSNHTDSATDPDLYGKLVGDAAAADKSLLV